MSKIIQEEQKIAAAFTIPKNVPQTNAPPGSGYSRQTVNVEGLGSYLVSLIAADIGSTRVIVGTAADSNCGNDCPVLPLANYISRNGAYAGINGSYFCPATYASCAGKTNSYDLLVMNHKETYFNSDNNVYSGNPAVIFGDGYVRFVSAASQWGRDTSLNGVLSNFPLLVFNGQVTFGGDDDPKKGSKGGRSFVAIKGDTVYIGVVHSATVAESARVMKTLGMTHALNLDDGGSTALWSGGYKVGPGRNFPNVILFVAK
ncbi:phosphodiester glycosidase family protein [Patescibacteria group bacterium]|nr:phosphodiester glycosidase family protein [Patescibacteria group bacterium]